MRTVFLGHNFTSGNVWNTESVITDYIYYTNSHQSVYSNDQDIMQAP